MNYHPLSLTGEPGDWYTSCEEADSSLQLVRRRRADGVLWAGQRLRREALSHPPLQREEQTLPPRRMLPRREEPAHIRVILSHLTFPSHTFIGPYCNNNNNNNNNNNKLLLLLLFIIIVKCKCSLIGLSTLKLYLSQHSYLLPRS